MNRKDRNAAEGDVLRGVSELVNAGTLDGSEDTASPTKYKYVEPRHHSRRTSKFAQQIAAEEFGHHRHFAWRQWGGFRDVTPAEARKRRSG